jgi:hypothetical protein
LDANQAVSFFVCIVNTNPLHRRDAVNVQSISLPNDKTQEKLVINGIHLRPEAQDFVMISRYTMGANEECIKEERREIIDRIWWMDREEKQIEVDIKSGYFTCSLI